MKRIPKQAYTAEFKELSVMRVKSRQTISSVERDLGLIEQTLRNWIKVADAVG
jgi:transposase